MKTLGMTAARVGAIPRADQAAYCSRCGVPVTHEAPLPSAMPLAYEDALYRTKIHRLLATIRGDSAQNKCLNTATLGLYCTFDYGNKLQYVVI